MLSSIAFLSKYGSRDHCLWSTSSPSWTVAPWCPKAKRRSRVKSTQNYFSPQLTWGLTDSSWRLWAERMYPSAVGSPSRDFCSNLEEWSKSAAISGWWQFSTLSYYGSAKLRQARADYLPVLTAVVKGYQSIYERCWVYGNGDWCCNPHTAYALVTAIFLTFCTMNFIEMSWNFYVYAVCSALLIQTQHTFDMEYILTWSLLETNRCLTHLAVAHFLPFKKLPAALPE